MSTNSEQSAGILPLLALAFLVGATAWESNMFKMPVYCHTVIDYEYLGRDENGRPEFKYTEREVCKE